MITHCWNKAELNKSWQIKEESFLTDKIEIPSEEK
jgi:hypothetical protein